MSSTFYYDLAVTRGYDFDSSAIETVAYNRAEQNLFVEFVSGGCYVYGEVPESLYHVFVEADSLGNFYREGIAGKYDSWRCADNVFLHKVDTAEPEPEKLNADVNVNTVNSITVSDISAMAITPTVIATSVFGVHWTSADGLVSGKPEFHATSEQDAVDQFYAAMDAAKTLDLMPQTYRIVSVTHYFD